MSTQHRRASRVIVTLAATAILFAHSTETFAQRGGGGGGGGGRGGGR
jgi:hypothetical protein